MPGRFGRFPRAATDAHDLDVAPDTLRPFRDWLERNERPLRAGRAILDDPRTYGAHLDRTEGARRRVRDAVSRMDDLSAERRTRSRRRDRGPTRSLYRYGEEAEIAGNAGSLPPVRQVLAYGAPVPVRITRRRTSSRQFASSHIEGGRISVAQQKSGERLLIPIHEDLASVLENIPRLGTNIVHRTDGRGYTGSGFASIFQREQKRLGLGALQFHGLRHTAAARLAEAGATDREIMSILGRTSPQKWPDFQA